jgi:sigma-E factor negative regulatory protein RseA
MSDAMQREYERLGLSALMDGEAADAEAERALRDWRDDARARADWHVYHLVGDVLRSSDLAQSPAHDEAFVQALRQRLAQTPVVLAPASPASVRRVRRRWIGSAAVAAGFVAVAGVMVVTRLAVPGGEPGGVLLASQPALSTPVLRVSNLPAVGGGEGALIRDAQLDRYLEAHRQFGPSAALLPGGVVRSAASVAPQR